VGLAGDSTGIFYGVIMQLNLFESESVKYVMPYNLHPRGTICGKCHYFIWSKTRLSFDGYCSFHAFDTQKIDQRLNDGTGWFFFTEEQSCSIGNSKPATAP
jgi:hypothetical protein